MSVFSCEWLLIICVLISQHFLETEWVSFVVFFGGAMLFFRILRENGRFFLSSIWPLLVFFLVGLGGVFRGNTHDVIRDVVFSLNAIFLLAIGYYANKDRQALFMLFRVFVFCGAFMAIIHFVRIINGYEIIIGAESLNLARSMMGFNRLDLVFISLILVLFVKKNSDCYFLTDAQRIFFASLFLFSATFSFSRIGLGLFFLYSLSLSGVFEKKKTWLLGVLVFFGVALYIFFQGKVDHDAHSFVAKLARTFQEIAIQDYFDSQSWNDNWRGFETKKVIDAYQSGNFVQLLFGQGFGALVDLGVYINLGEEDMRYIPVFHNGFAYVLFKAGFIGLVCYVLFYFRLLFALKKVSAFLSETFAPRFFLATTLASVGAMYVFGGIAQMQSLELSIFLGAMIRVVEFD